jgi:hypothetical protein
MTKNTTKIVVAVSGLVIATVLLYPVSASLVRSYTQNQINIARKTRIESIYHSLKLDSRYQLVSSSVFGEKKPYEWDKSRTYSSSEVFRRDANVDVSAADARNSIEKAGFAFIGEPYPGSAFTEWHFESSNKEYIRLNVSSQPRDDALRKQAGSDKLNFDGVPGPNQGPSTVTIKVNLDDNNE